MNRLDVDLLDRSFSGLADSLLQNRQLDERKKERGEDVDFRERELAERVKQTGYERDPANPENRERTARASMMEDNVKKLGISQIDTDWVTADGRKMSMKGSMDEVIAAQKAAPPDPQQKVTSKFITKDGVEHTIIGTPTQLKAQQDSIGKSGGGIIGRENEIQQITDADGKTHTAVVNARTGAVHILKEQADGTVTVETGKRDPLTGEISVTRTTNRTAPGAPGAGAAAPKVITDRQGRKWRYKGSQPDPTKDKDPKNWEAVK